MKAHTAIQKARDEGRAALIGYLPVGYPSVSASIDAMHTLVESGVDVIEVGVPYTDPVMDGPVIQQAAQHALEQGVRMRDALSAVHALSSAGTPAVVMTYWNLIERYGVERFAHDVARADGAGAITPDLLPEEASEWLAATDKHELERVFLVAPSSRSERVRSTTEACRGFVYATALMGVTGVRSAVSDDAQTLVARVRSVSDLPVGVGLGVSTGAQAAQVGAYADAVIVGSALVRCLLDASSEAEGLKRLRDLSTELVEGTRSVR